VQDVLIGVDPHKASNTLAVLDPMTKTPIDGGRFANTAKGFEELMAFAQRWDDRRWAVEGCHGAGRSLAQRLVASGESVLDVPAKLAARVRVFSTGHGRKTDRDDAISVGLAALDGEGVAPAVVDGATTSLRLLSDRRQELVGLRTQAACRLHRLLVELAPGGMSSELSAKKAASVLVRLRPEGEVAQVRFQLATEHLADIEAIDAKIKATTAQITALVKTSGTGLIDLYGIGPVIAGRILAEVDGIARFPTKDHFASYNGTAPIDASSGDQVRHRLSRAGNRRLNHALHMMAVTQLRQPETMGRVYYERKRQDGKTPKEALRCLKRRLSDIVFRQLVADSRGRIEGCGSPTIAKPTRSTSTSPTASSRPAGRPPSKPSRPQGSKRPSCSTGKTTVSSASKSSTPASGSRRTSSTVRKSSAERRSSLVT
jgi:transposase